MAQNGGTSSATNIRALELFFALYESHKGLTRAELARTIPGYRGLDERALQETQKRDFDALSAIGVRFDEEPGPDHRGRVRIHPDTVTPGTSIELTGRQMTLIRMAFDAWDGEASTDLAVTHTKLRASTKANQNAYRGGPDSASAVIHRKNTPTKGDNGKADQPGMPDADREGHASGVVGGIEGSPALSTILAAITQRQPITFGYTSSSGRMERGIDPWNLIIRGRSIYLWGWDHDRQDDRLFKLSRIEGPVECIGEPGDAEPVPPSIVNPFDDFACEPLLFHRIGVDIPFLATCEALQGVQTPPGWRAVRGPREEWGVWAQRLIAHGKDVVPREPASLVERLRTQLLAATEQKMVKRQEKGQSISHRQEAKRNA